MGSAGPPVDDVAPGEAEPGVEAGAEDPSELLGSDDDVPEGDAPDDSVPEADAPEGDAPEGDAPGVADPVGVDVGENADAADVGVVPV